jgi:hypothetical protein
MAATEALLAAEKAVLGTAMSSLAAARIAEAALTADDWFHPRHAEIWRVVAELTVDGVTADPTLVLLGLEDAGAANRCGGAVYLHECYAAAVPVGTVEALCGKVADGASLRRLRMAGQRIAQRADDTADPAELATWAAEQLTTANTSRRGVRILGAAWEEWIAATPDDRTMLIPDLLGEGDRLVLTGQGGLGKSTLLQQIAVCAAAGLPPFDWQWHDPYDPLRVLILDFENPEHRTKTRLWPMVRYCVKLGHDPRPNLFVDSTGNPLDVLDPANALSLLATVEHFRPQLVYIGPVYKMHNDDPDKEIVVKKITTVLDRIRATGAAIITEAHTTKEGQRGGGSLSPSGANLWSWWPEFGCGLRLQPGDEADVMRRCDLERWRIDRDGSGWPHEVESSGLPLPWVRCAPPGMANAPVLERAPDGF